MIRTEDHLREIITIFFAKKRTILATTATFVLFAALVSLFWPPVYSATSQVLVKAKKLEKSPEALEDTQIRMFELDTEDLASEMQIMTSPDVLSSAITSMAEQGLVYDKSTLHPDNLSEAVQKLQKELDTEIIPKSNIIEVSISGSDPKRVTTILRYLVASYIAHRGNIYTPSEVEDFFDKQVQRFSGNLEEKENELRALVAETGAPNPSLEIQHNLTRKRTLEIQLNELETSVVEREKLIAHLRQALTSEKINFFSFVNNLTINQISEKLQALVIEEGNLLRIYTPNHEEVIAIREHVASLFGRLQTEVQAFLKNESTLLSIDTERLGLIRQRLQDIAKRNVTLHGQLIEQQSITREMDLLKHSYATFTKRLEESRISGSSDANTLFMVSVLSQPYSTGLPVFPNKKAMLPLALLAGFITGCSLGFLREYFDHTFKKPEDAERYAGMLALFSIPAWKE
ncbi:MAG: GumC family protein [Desulfovibrio sp.]